MRYSIFIIFVFFVVQIGIAQNETYFGDQLERKGRFYVYWGWNRTAYTPSDMHFGGEGYNFTLSNVEARDYQPKFDARLYFRPKYFKRQQSNFRFGYFFKENWTISIGRNHMKYVIPTDFLVRIDGHIGKEYSPLEGNYENDTISVGDYMRFGYGDGLDYWNVSIGRFDQILNLNQVRICFTEGIGLGGVRTVVNSDFLTLKHYANKIWSGYGADATLGLRIGLFQKFFLQTDATGGIINLTNVVTDHHLGKVNHRFFFAQANVSVGVSFLFERKNY